MSNFVEVTPYECESGYEYVCGHIGIIHEGGVTKLRKIHLNVDNVSFCRDSPNTFTELLTEYFPPTGLFKFFKNGESRVVGEVVHEGYYRVRLNDGSTFHILEEDRDKIINSKKVYVNA